MRYVTVALDTDEPAFHPVEHELAAEPSLRRRAIHAVEELADGSLVLLTEVAGDLDRYRKLMADSPAVHEFAVSEDGSGICYSRVEPTPMTQRVLRRQKSSPVVVEMPLEYAADGTQLVTVVGREADLVEAAGDFPEAFETELVSTGPYRPSTNAAADLTDRQREVVETAVRLGYYENPREATHEDVATELDVEPGTVGKHLRIAESKLFSRLFG